MILDVVLYYFSILKDLMLQILDKVPITKDVSYLMLVVALMLVLTFITILRFSFGGNGLNTMKSYNRKLKREAKKEGR